METIQHQKLVKSNKYHLCSYCNMSIYKGTQYLRSFHKHEGQVYQWKSHTHCSDIANKLKMFDDCDEGVTGEDFDEYIRNEYDKYGMEFLKNQSFKFKLEFVLSKHNINYNP